MKENTPEMLPRERVFAALAGTDFDCVPAINPTSVANYECMRATGTAFPQAHTDAHAMAALARAGHTLLGFDSVMPYFSVHLEAEMLGCTVDWNNPDGMPYVTKRALLHPGDWKPPKNITGRPLFRQLLQAIRLLRRSLGDQAVVIGKVLGPWSLAYNLYGVENLLLDVILDPEPIREFIRALLEVSVECARAQFEAGADLVTWADHVTADLISKEQYADFMFPLHRQAAARLTGKPLILHTCGNVMDRLDLFCDTGFRLFHMDSRNHLRQAVDIAGNRLALTGSVNNPVTLVNGSTVAIHREVQENIRAGIRLIAPECAIPFKVTNASLISLVNSAHRTRPQSIVT